jgi:tripartite-type tricarboxylate transporter receptor subunit TctC
VVNPLQRWRSVAELVADAKAHAGKLNYGSAGTGTVPHLSGELFRSAAGVDLVHVPYRGGAFARLLVAQNQKWPPIVRALNLKAE